MDKKTSRFPAIGTFLNCCLLGFSRPAFGWKLDADGCERENRLCAATMELIGEALGDKEPRVLGYYLGKTLRFVCLPVTLLVESCTKRYAHKLIQQQEQAYAVCMAFDGKDIQQRYAEKVPAADRCTLQIDADQVGREFEAKEQDYMRKHLGHEICTRLFSGVTGISLCFTTLANISQTETYTQLKSFDFHQACQDIVQLVASQDDPSPEEEFPPSSAIPFKGAVARP